MALVEDGSILMSIKKLLNVEHNDPAFDVDVGMAINAEFMTLHQLGIGPAEGFHINDADTVWTDFSDDKSLIDAVKQYIFLKVRMIFDAPASSIVADSYNSRIHELEFRLNVQAERNQNTAENSEEKDILDNIPTMVPKNLKPIEPIIQTTSSVSTPKPKPKQNSDYSVDGENLQLSRNIF